MTTQNRSQFYLTNGLRRCARYDTIFYGAYAGAGATFDMRVRFDLKQKINTARDLGGLPARPRHCGRHHVLRKK